MGYPLQAGAPQITVTLNGVSRHFAIYAATENSPVGTLFQVLLLENNGTEWINIGPGAGFYSTLDPSSINADIAAHGGSVNFLKWLLATINAFLVNLGIVNGAAPVPTDGAGIVIGLVNGMQFEAVDGQPLTLK